jgi:hypothetical protein
MRGTLAILACAAGLSLPAGALAGTPPAGIAGFPPDATYDRLTPAQKEVLRARYEAMPEGDEPPYPAEGIGPLLRPLLDSAARMHMDGWIDAIVDVDSQGKATAVSVYQSPDPLLTKLVAALMMEQRYKPGRCKGTPCAMPFSLRLDLAAR